MDMRWSAAQTLSWIIRQEPLELKQWTLDMGPLIIHAQKKLADEIAAGHVHAWGRPQPHGLVEQVPNSQFQISGLTVAVGVHGDMITLAARPHQPFSSYEGPRWHSIEFEAVEIERAWPRPPPLSAVDWMLREAEQVLKITGHLAKRHDLLDRCSKETACTKREAEAAHKVLPEQFKGGRGRRRINPT
jgi:hypothetical protein